jgi:hypothetical protein
MFTISACKHGATPTVITGEETTGNARLAASNTDLRD